MSFENLSLIPDLKSALKKAGYKEPTPIQKQAIPIVLEGHDLLGIAQTGTGKTAAFCLPMLQLLTQKKRKNKPRTPRALILAPTRELAMQIYRSFTTYGQHLPLKATAIFGGVKQGNQVRELARGIDILIATPGRLLDLVHQKHLSLSEIEIFVLDEADRMLDMGFFRDIRKIVPLLPQQRHNLFFSATMPPEIESLAQTILRQPRTVEITPPATTVERINQSVYFVDKEKKLDLLYLLLESNDLYKVLIFVGMKHKADKVVDKLRMRDITVASIHGDKSQGARQRALADFARDRIRVLVATDIASRGIDIDNITHVINFDLPKLAEDYVHRIGRTARAGTQGHAISLCAPDERAYLKTILRTTGAEIRAVDGHPFASSSSMHEPAKTVQRQKPRPSHGSAGAKGNSQNRRRRKKSRFRRQH